MSKKKTTKMTAAQKADAAARSEKLRQEAIRATDPDAPPAAAKAPSKAPAKKASKASKSKLSGLDAAHAILVEAKEPMRVRDVTKRAIERGLWSTGGATPHQTLAAAIGREIAGKGKASRFAKTGRGLFAANPGANPGGNPGAGAKGKG